MLCTTTSADAISFFRASSAPGFFRSSARLFLLRFRCRYFAAMPGVGERPPIQRARSPEGCSILMTSAPKSARNCVA